MEPQVEHEVCANCKREIPHFNYVMHTAHCARNINLCPRCKEPFPKSQIEEHAKGCRVSPKKPQPPPTHLEKNGYYRQQKSIEDAKVAQRKEKRLERMERLVDVGHTLRAAPPPLVDSGHSLPGPPANGCRPKPKPSLAPCRYCELELPKGDDLEEHESYCGARTDKCAECGEHVMFKYKKLHVESNHGFLKLSDEPGPRPSWEQTAPPPDRPRRRPAPLRPFADFELPFPEPGGGFAGRAAVATVDVNGEKLESSKEIARRLDCKTEYIRNLLHDSASITVPLRSAGTMPRNHFNHNKGPAPQPPSRRRNPPTELEIPCEFCNTPIPHEDLIQHETGCRPDLARLRLRKRSPSPDYFAAPAPAPTPSSPEVELPYVKLPCEFCEELIPEDDLILHETGCELNSAEAAAKLD